jgi:hypothetical protein
MSTRAEGRSSIAELMRVGKRMSFFRARIASLKNM